MTGLVTGFYAPAGTDPDADLINWHTSFNNGEPYDDRSGNPLPPLADIRDELTTHHSSYYIDHSQPPAPMLISNGFTDDLFPVDEADALLQPHAHRAPRHADLAVLRELRPPARAEQGSPTGRC